MDVPPELQDLDWDEWSLEHIGKHAVTRAEVEDVVFGEAVVRQTYKNRLQVIGPTRDGRVLSVIVGAVPDQPNVYYPFSARPASRSERRFYLQRKDGRPRGRQ